MVIHLVNDIDCDYNKLLLIYTELVQLLHLFRVYRMPVDLRDRS